MRALVTGGAGFIGSWVADLLIEQAHEVVILDNLSTGDEKNINPRAKFYNLDLRDNLDEVFRIEKPDIVFHLAGQINVRKSIEDPKNDAEINIIGSLNLFSQCAKNGVKKIIFSSTGGAIYGEKVSIPTPESEVLKPESPYGIAKRTIELYLEFYKKVHGLNYTVLRYSNVYGPRQNAKGEAGVVSIFINNLLNGKESSIFGAGHKTRDYVYVKDVARANILAMKLNGVYNVGTGVETSVNEIFSKVEEAADIKGKKKHTAEIEGELERSALDCSKLKAEGWSPEYNLDKGMKETFEYVKNGVK